jgi:hypothetical protein
MKSDTLNESFFHYLLPSLLALQAIGLFLRITRNFSMEEPIKVSNVAIT